MHYSLFIFIVLSVGLAIGCFLGEAQGQKNTMREAYNNGLATKEIVGEAVVYRWIETHKIGYDVE